MAYLCIMNSDLECDGCMMCKAQSVESFTCENCGEIIGCKDELYADEEYETLCIDCLKELHRIDTSMP